MNTKLKAVAAFCGCSVAKIKARLVNYSLVEILCMAAKERLK